MTFFILDTVLYGVPIVYTWCEYLKGKWNWNNLKKALRFLGFQNRKPLELVHQTIILLGALLIVNFLLGMILAQPALEPWNDTQKVEQTVREIQVQFPWLLLYLLTVRVIGEEIFFRGWLVPKLGVVGSSIAFGIVHAGFGSWVEILGAFLLGLILAYSFEKNQTIYPNIIAHIVYNVLIIYVFSGMQV